MANNGEYTDEYNDEYLCRDFFVGFNFWWRLSFQISEFRVHCLKSTTAVSFHVRDLKRERLTPSLAIYNGAVYFRLTSVLTKTSPA